MIPHKQGVCSLALNHGKGGAVANGRDWAFFPIPLSSE